MSGRPALYGPVRELRTERTAVHFLVGVAAEGGSGVHHASLAQTGHGAARTGQGGSRQARGFPEDKRGESPAVVRGFDDRKNVIPAETFDSYATFVKRFAEKNPGQTWPRFRADMDAAHAKFQVEIKIPDMAAARAVLEAVSKTPGLAEAAKGFSADLKGKLQTFEQGAKGLVDTATLLRDSVVGAVNGTHQTIQRIEALRDIAKDKARAEIARILNQDVPGMFAADSNRCRTPIRTCSGNSASSSSVDSNWRTSARRLTASSRCSPRS